MTPRPVALTVKPDGIPEALKREPRWVVWRYEQRQGSDRWAKILCTTAGRHAKSNDPATWTTFPKALARYQAGGFDGIGFCLGDGWAGVDFDHCRYPDEPALVQTFSTLPDAEKLLARLGCYHEVSPSGTGYKAIGRSPRIGGQIDFRELPPVMTTWPGSRFFAVTGHDYDFAPDPTVDITEFIANTFKPATFVTTDRPVFVRPGDVRGTERIESRTDDQVLTLASTAVNRDKFLRLWRGDLSLYGDDHSRADDALCCILAYWCQGDLDQVDRLFRRSGLMRDKWNTRSYREATLRKAGLVQRSAPLPLIDPSEVAYE